MTDRDQYIIKVQGKLIEVTPDVYYAYFQMRRQEQGQEEKKQRNDVVSYDALDEEETSGMEAMPDLISPSMEELAITQDIYDQLHRAIDALPRSERELIQAIYFDKKTEKMYADETGKSQTGVSYQLRRTLSKMRMFLDFTGSFPDFLL